MEFFLHPISVCNLGLTEKSEEEIVDFIKTLTDGQFPVSQTHKNSQTAHACNQIPGQTTLVCQGT